MTDHKNAETQSEELSLDQLKDTAGGLGAKPAPNGSSFQNQNVGGIVAPLTSRILDCPGHGDNISMTIPNDSPGPFDETGTTDEITGQNATVIVHPSFIPDTEDLTNLEEATRMWSPAPSCSFTAGPSGTSYLTGYTEVEWTYFADNVGGKAGTGGTTFFNENVNGTIGYEMEAGTDLRSDNRFVFEPMDVMPSLGESIDPGLDAAGGFQPHEVTGVQIGEPPEPKLWLQMLG